MAVSKDGLQYRFVIPGQVLVIEPVGIGRKIDGATEQEVLDRKLVRGTAVVPIGNLLKK